MKTKFKLNSKKTPVAMIDHRGVILRVYPSQSTAALCTDTCQSKISDVCRGIEESTKGLRFKFITNEFYNKLIDAFK